MTKSSAALVEDLVVDSLGSQADGVAPGPVYVPLTLPGERVRVERHGERADLLEVLSPSADRIAPACPHYGECGGCALQHWAQAPYLAWKAEQVRLALGRERIETEIAAAVAVQPGTRRRLALHARPGKGGAKLGFKARRSWRLVDIAACSVADPRLVAALPALERLAAPFLEHPKSAPTLHVTLTATGLDVDVTGVERRSGGLSADARVRAAAAAQAADMARVSLAGEIVYQARLPMVRLGPAAVALPPGAFLQATPQAEAAMAALAVEAVRGAGRIADLYCGVGTFTFRLAEVAPVYAADSAAPAVRALTAALATAPGLKSITAEARDLVRRPVLASELKKIDAVVFDPPRAGALEQAGEIGRSTAQRVVGVSCNPATFARDARILTDAGFRLDRVAPVDQFLWSPHIELVGVFSR
ncbi:RNA methyltransferase [Caulobacter sp. CCUG 60055]|uniref:class I SAM-dependent RNA methyltransferase n=1 Tax=Caulobacter sp. CCUG 60055 TaxID=2100090 RepID=UPI001FA7105F|nr:class I SAM-dependent RNA methyltransferase [Caulobacteraceae bacterium]MCI3182215.1 RNA methyltransferase [Caulobacter sp. CCUG 60055]